MTMMVASALRIFSSRLCALLDVTLVPLNDVACWMWESIDVIVRNARILSGILGEWRWRRSR